MSRLTEYDERTGIVFDDPIDKLIRESGGGGGGMPSTIDTGEPPKDKLIDTKTIKGVTYKMYQDANGNSYVINGDTGARMEGSFADNGLSGTGTSSSSGSSSSSSAKEPKGPVTRKDLEDAGATFFPGGAVFGGKEYELQTDGSYKVSGNAPKETSQQGVLNPAIAALKGFTGKPSKEQLATGASAATNVPFPSAAGQTAQNQRIAPGEIKAPQGSPFTQRGEVVGTLPFGFLGNAGDITGTEAAMKGQGLTNVPITYGGVPFVSDVGGFGLTPVESRPSQFEASGILGNTGVGAGFNTRNIAGTLGFALEKPKSNSPEDIAQANAINQSNALTLINQRAKQGESPEGVRLRERFPQMSPETAGVALQQAASGYNPATDRGLSFVSPSGAVGSDIYDAMGVRQVLTGTGSKSGKTTLNLKENADASNLDSPYDLYAAKGFSGIVSNPTTLHVAENRPEAVTVQPLGGDYTEPPASSGAARTARWTAGQPQELSASPFPGYDMGQGRLTYSAGYSPFGGDMSTTNTSADYWQAKQQENADRRAMLQPGAPSAFQQMLERFLMGAMRKQGRTPPLSMVGAGY